MTLSPNSTNPPAKYIAKIAQSLQEKRLAFALRAKMFRSGQDDTDDLDESCQHILIQEGANGPAVGTIRMRKFSTPKDLRTSYSAQFYDLSPLPFDGPVLELGRFCVDPDHNHPGVLRLTWAQVVRVVLNQKIARLMGCTSFSGNDPAPYDPAFFVLRERHLGPEHQRPKIKAPKVHRLPQIKPQGFELKKALSTLPPLLRSYLSLGGTVSDHAVIDRDLNTMHVFTNVDIKNIPAARRKILQAMA